MSVIRGIDTTIIKRAWNRATSASPDRWTRDNPAMGQCAITALVVQDCIGGTLVRTVAILPDGSEESHYATLHEDGVILDFTEQQFPSGTEFGPFEERTRDYVLSFQPTRDRYMLLCQRMNEIRTLDRVASAQ